MKTTYTKNGIVIELESTEAYEIVAQSVMGAWDEMSGMRPIVPARFLKDYDKAMNVLSKLRGEIHSIASAARSYERKNYISETALERAIIDYEFLKK
jgi:hypothetical protein